MFNIKSNFNASFKIKSNTKARNVTECASSNYKYIKKVNNSPKFAVTTISEINFILSLHTTEVNI